MKYMIYLIIIGIDLQILDLKYFYRLSLHIMYNESLIMIFSITGMC